MMRGVSTWAVAVRKPARGARIERRRSRQSSRSSPWAKRHRLLRLPVIRGVVALGESLKIGFRALGDLRQRAARADEDEEPRRSAAGSGA